MRPPVENYARCSVPVGDVVVEPGIEMRDEDDFHALIRELWDVGRWIGLGFEAQPARPRIAVCRDAAAEFERRWPGRAFFVELHDASHGVWSQTYQPFGMPRNTTP